MSRSQLILGVFGQLQVSFPPITAYMNVMLPLLASMHRVPGIRHIMAARARRPTKTICAKDLVLYQGITELENSLAKHITEFF